MLSERAEKGAEKASILLLSLGEDAAAEIMRNLNPKEVQRLGSKMTRTSNISLEQVDDVMMELLEYTSSQTSLGLNSSSYIKGVLNKALGEEKASYLLDSILTSSDTSGIEGLKWMEPQAVAELIKNEHPQIIATILVYLETEQSAAILNFFNDELKSNVVIRIATLEGVQPAALSHLNDVLSKLLTNGGDKLAKKNLGGARTAAEILNQIGASSEKVVLDAISDVNTELAEKIQDEMFTFENLLDISDRDMQNVLGRIDLDQLVIALKGVSSDIKNKVFKNMTVRKGEELKEKIEYKGAVRVGDIEAAQKELLKTIRAMGDNGEITIMKGGDSVI